jgi:hypothetical protein
MEGHLHALARTDNAQTIDLSGSGSHCAVAACLFLQPPSMLYHCPDTADSRLGVAATRTCALISCHALSTLGTKMMAML